MRWARRRVRWLALAILLVLPLFISDPLLQTIAVLSMIYAAASTGWNLLGGYAGQISFGHGVFFGAGAYVTGYLLVHYGWSPWLGMGASAVVAVIVALVMGLPFFRLKTHYFAIATLGLLEVISIAVTNSAALGGTQGFALPVLPSSWVNLEFPLQEQGAYYILALGLWVVSFIVAGFLLDRRPGTYWEAIRDDEDAARAMGVPVVRYKAYAICVGAVLTAFAGAVYAMYGLYVDPGTVLGVATSVLFVLMAVVGGIGTRFGPLVGAIIVTVFQQGAAVWLGGAGNGLDVAAYGLAVIVVAVLEPRGLVGVVERIRGLQLGSRAPSA